MKVIRAILYVIACLLVLLTVLIIVCAYNPNLTAKLQGLVFRGKTIGVAKVSSDEAYEDYDELSVNAVGGANQKMRSIEELGISEDSMITTLEDYYNNCHDQIVEHGIGEYSFENVIATEELVKQVYASYSTEEYVGGYMDSTLNEIGASSYNMDLLVEELKDKHFRLTHQIVLNEGD
ncbi:MAG: hypothetical protein K6E63_02540 [Lachnospiraceae bacterium]|nr:hypothetical protein [Lachnospiraceae bacterium]